MRRLKQAALCAMSVLLTGCSALNFSVEGLVDAPKLTEEQAEIHQALIESVGSNITLKYPRNGDHRSAYVIANIDDEPDNEAIVFYEYKDNVKDNGMRINVLDTDESGKWHSVKELHGAGTDIDKVMISSFGHGSTQVLVGYQNPATDDKTLEIYSYHNDVFEKIGTDTYSVLEMMDIDSDGDNELVAVQKTVNPETEKVSAKASMLVLDAGEVKREQTIDMCDNVSTYVKSTKGMLGDGRNALFIDSLNSEGLLQTELVYFRYSTLQNPIQQLKEKLLPGCTRPSGYYCADIDGDTVVEIPLTKPMLGYENAAVADEMLYMTTWNVYKDFYTLEEKYTGYYSIQNGFFLSFPKRWADKVTVRRDGDTGDVVCYEYSGDINTSTTELVRFCSVTKNNADEKLSQGYETVDTRGQLQYFVKFPKDTDNQLVLTIDEVKNNFYIID